MNINEKLAIGKPYADRFLEIMKAAGYGNKARYITNWNAAAMARLSEINPSQADGIKDASRAPKDGLADFYLDITFFDKNDVYIDMYIREFELGGTHNMSVSALEGSSISVNSVDEVQTALLAKLRSAIEELKKTGARTKTLQIVQQVADKIQAVKLPTTKQPVNQDQGIDQSNKDPIDDVKVTKIGNRWHARLIENGKVIDEMACERREDIGWISREMLRWYAKTGGSSRFADSARDRHNESTKPAGKIWYRPDLEKLNQDQGIDQGTMSKETLAKRAGPEVAAKAAKAAGIIAELEKLGYKRVGTGTHYDYSFSFTRVGRDRTVANLEYVFNKELLQIQVVNADDTEIFSTEDVQAKFADSDAATAKNIDQAFKSWWLAAMNLK